MGCDGGSITSVGATQDFAPERAVDILEGDFFSGGGFSNYFARPAYQEEAVGDYVKSLGGANKGLFNPGGRGVPDVRVFSRTFVWEGELTERIFEGRGARVELQDFVEWGVFGCFGNERFDAFVCELYHSVK